MRYGEQSNLSGPRILWIVVAGGVALLVLVFVYIYTHRHLGSIPDYRNPAQVTVQTDASDQAKIDALRAQGADLTKPTTVTHFLYVPSQGLADTAAQRLRGYHVQVKKTVPPRPGLGWLVLAEITTAPTPEYFRSSRLLFNELAIEYGGDYFKWEAAITK